MTAPPSATRGWALVTGASSGIGASFARALDARGYSVVLVARRRDRLETLAATLRRAEVLAADLGDEAEVARVAAHAQSLGDVELVVNNAGYATNGDFLALDDAREVAMVKLNALAPLLLAQKLVPAMVARHSGGVINVASIAAFQPVPYMATYGATKSFLLSWSEALGYELRTTGVRVTCVCPGPTATEFFEVAAVDPRMARLPHVMSADEVVARTLDAFDDGRAMLVPGFVNWLTAFSTRIFPRLAVRVVTGRLFAPRTRKALRP
ncbi:MAG: SDR family oxidoreductase [Myxococcales bacterium]|nr:SDR family oxidoreductase [Myxococcales bacterium]